jgi:hypothetical protein
MRGDAGARARSGAAVTVGRRVLAMLVAGALAAAGAAACSKDEGRTLRKPSADQTTTTTTAPAADSAGGTGGARSGAAVGTGSGATASAGPTAPLQLTSSAFVDGGPIPADYTCRGADRSPPLLWTGVPTGTAEIALVVRDVDVGGFVHWVIAGMPPTTGGIAEDTPPAGAVEATNDLGRPGWSGPCPPSGTHNYQFTVYALAQPSGVTAGEAGGEAAAKVEAAPAVASAALSGQVSAD